ncbi:hypothetical protein [Embleya sp. NPDC059237]|uniref:hypothetical protein n=1 Tax=Embleya sp. NPDC059237 TaxID=3346784 RepID=UPI0036A45CE1
MTVSESARTSLSTPAPAAPRGASPVGGGRLAIGVLVALALSWLIPLAAYAAHATIVLPFVFLALVASLLRAGRTVLDRLVLAFALTAGAMCVAGLLFSAWPWGLHPVPVSGLGFSVLVLVAALLRRRPELPRLGTLPDLLTVGLTGVITFLTLWPYLGRGLVGRISLIAVAEDLGRHFALYDGIRTAGGYTFMHRPDLKAGLTDDLTAYPQGSHFAMGLFDNFWRAGTGAGSGQEAMNHFVYFYAATFVLMIFAVMWSMRWVAGTALSPWRYLVLASAAAAYLYFGDGMAMFLRGFPSEFAGLALLAILVAVVARPLSRLREQLCVLASLTIALSFTYYLFLPLAGAMLLVWLIGYRKQLLERRLLTAVVAVITAVGALIVPVVNWKYASKSEAVNAAGGISPTNRHLLMLLVFLVGLGLASRYAWRHPVRRRVILWMLGAVGIVALMFLYQTAVIGETSYYYEKLLHQLFVVALVCLGATWLVVPRYQPGYFRPGRRPRPAFANAWTAVPLALAVTVTIACNANPDRYVWRKPGKDYSWGVSYFLKGMDHPKLARAVLAAVQAQPDPDGKATILQMRNDWEANYYGTLWVDVMQRNLGVAWPVKPPLGTQESPAALKDRITRQFPGTPIRVMTNDPVTLDTVQRIRRDRPELGLDVLFSNPTRCGYRFEPVAAPAPGKEPAPVPVIPFPANGCKSKAKSPAPVQVPVTNPTNNPDRE